MCIGNEWINNLLINGILPIISQVAAHQLHVEASKWEEEGNLLIQAARKMAILFAKMSRFIT